MDKLTDSKIPWVTKVTKANASYSRMSKSTSHDHNSFVVSDHVIFYDKYKNLFRGIVASVGPSVVEIKLVSNNWNNMSIDKLPVCFIVCRKVMYV